MISTLFQGESLIRSNIDDGSVIPWTGTEALVKIGLGSLDQTLRGPKVSMIAGNFCLGDEPSSMLPVTFPSSPETTDDRNEPLPWIDRIRFGTKNAAAAPALANDEAQTPRWGHPNTVVFSDFTTRHRGCL